MSRNPFETALNSLYEASKIAGIDPNVVENVGKTQRVFQFSIPMRMDNGELKIFDAYRVHYCDALGTNKKWHKICSRFRFGYC